MNPIDLSLRKLAKSFLAKDIYNDSAVVEFVNKLYRGVDKLQRESYLKGLKRVDCSVGCSSCCSHWVEDIYSFEAVNILDAISKLDIDVIYSIVRRAKESVQSFEEIYLNSINSSDNELLYKFYAKGIECPLLSTNGECLIYSSRPLTCRGYHSESLSRFCLSTSEELNMGTYNLLPDESVMVLLDQIHESIGGEKSTALRVILSDYLKKG